MGLDLSCGMLSCGRWSYSGFHEFRKKIAEQVGIDLDKMEGFNTVDKAIISELGFQAYLAACAEHAGQISWDTIDDPIKSLLCHSDCDGELTPDLCGPIADRLEEIVMNWPEKLKFDSEEWIAFGRVPDHIDNYDLVQCRRLIAGLRHAVEYNLPVKFH